MDGNKSYVYIDGEQVMTATFVFQQMMYQSARIDRARRVALVSAGISLCSLLIQILLRAC